MKSHVEICPGKIKVKKLSVNFLRKGIRCLFPCTGQPVTGFGKTRFRLLIFHPELLSSLLVILETCKFLFLRSKKIQNDVYRPAVFCLKMINRIKPFLTFREFLIREAEITQILRKVTVKIIQEILDFRKSSAQFPDLLIIFTYIIKKTGCSSDGLPSTVRIVISGQFMCIAGGNDDLTGICKFSVSLFKLLIFTRLKIRFLYFIDFKFKERHPAKPLLLTQLLTAHLLPESRILFVLLSYFLLQGEQLIASVRVKEVQLMFTAEKFLMLALPVYVKQKRCTFSDLGSRPCLTVDPAYTSVPLDPAGDINNAFLLRNDTILFECCQRLRIADFEQKLHQTERCVFPHKASGCLSPECHRDGINDNRFSRTGLTGENVEPLREIDIYFTYQGKIFDMQISEHPAPPRQYVHFSELFWQWIVFFR